MNPLLEKAVFAARSAGAAIMELYETSDFNTKVDGSPVTLADIRSDEILTELLNETGIPILSEEAEGIPVPYPERLWIIDPLDGTKDFLSKTGDFAVMIGLLERGAPILGVVYVPSVDVLYYAELGSGAYKVELGMTSKLEVARSAEEPLRFLSSVNNFAPYMETITKKLQARRVPHGSIGVKAGLIAVHEGDFFLSRGALGEWDVCAPEIILREAGGKVTDCNGNPLMYGNLNHRLQNGIVFSNGECHERVIEAIRSTL